MKPKNESGNYSRVDAWWLLGRRTVCLMRHWTGAVVGDESFDVDSHLVHQSRPKGKYMEFRVWAWHVHALISAKGQSLQPPHALNYFRNFRKISQFCRCSQNGKIFSAFHSSWAVHGRGCFSENSRRTEAHRVRSANILSHWIYISNKSQFYYSCSAVWRECEYDTIDWGTQHTSWDREQDRESDAKQIEEKQS